MTGVDLLFDEKRGSERLHQIALASLLRHTDLLSELGYSDVDGDLVWEPEGGLFDLAVRGEETPDLWVEVKVHGKLGGGQVAKQFEFIEGEGRDSDHILYLLLGWSRIPDYNLRRSLESADPSLTSRVQQVDGSSLQEALSSVVSDGGESGTDTLVSSYGDQLAAFDDRLDDFEGKPASEWGRTEHFAFYDACRRRADRMDGANIDYAATAAGGRVVSWWSGRTLHEEPRVNLYPQWESPLKDDASAARLGFKISVDSDDSETQRSWRNRVSRLVRDQADGELTVVKPNRFGTGRHMTVAVVDDRPVSDGGEVDWKLVEQSVEEAEQLVRSFTLDA